MTVDLVQERLNRGYSRRQLAAEIKVPENTLKRIEEGMPIRPAAAKKVADFYGYKVTEIMPVRAATA